MEENEIKERIEASGVKKTLEGICSELNGFFISPSDRHFIENVHAGESGPAEIIFGPLSRITEHAEYLRTNNKVAYKIRGQFLTLNQLRELIAPYVLSRYISTADENKLTRLSRWVNLSTFDILAIERIIDGIEEKEFSGAIFYNPKGGRIYHQYGNKVVNFALGRGRAPTMVSTRDILQVRERYMTEAGTVDLSGLYKQLKGEKQDISTLRLYSNVLTLLQDYLNAIDPEKHEIHGLIKAVPKISNL